MDSFKSCDICKLSDEYKLEYCEVCNVSEEFKTEFVFDSRKKMDTFLMNIHNWLERDKREKEKKELNLKIKHFKETCNISTMKEAKLLYLAQLNCVENIIEKTI